MKVTIEKSQLNPALDELVIRIPANVTNPEPSSSGKTLIVATSSGNKATTATVKGQPIIVGVNAYIKR